MFSFICARINRSTNSRDMGDLKPHSAYNDVTVMITSIIKCRMKLVIYSQTSMAQPLQFGNGTIISLPLYLVCKYLSLLGFKLIWDSKSVPAYCICMSLTLALTITTVQNKTFTNNVNCKSNLNMSNVGISHSISTNNSILLNLIKTNHELIVFEAFDHIWSGSW